MREFLMLARDFNPRKHKIAGWYASIKYDGQRCLWDGGVSRGIFKTEIPWANLGRDGRFVEEQICTGLWSRYGNIIHAPDWWIDKLPKGVCCDGELYIDRGCFQQTRSIVSRLPKNRVDTEWSKIQYLIFDKPSPWLVFDDGTINNPNWVYHRLEGKKCLKFFPNPVGPKPFELVEGLTVDQEKLPDNEADALDRVYAKLDEEVALGGEGLILRHPERVWAPGRSHAILKVKQAEDSEGIIVGWKEGVGKLTGMMGALGISWQGERFYLSGFTEEERRLCNGELVHFKIGETVTFKYMGLTRDGVPREPRFWRK